MDRFDRSTEYNSYGVPSFTTASANLSLSGFEDFSALSDPAIYEAASFSGHSYTPTYALPSTGPISGYSSAAQHNLSSGPLRSPHGTYLLSCHQLCQILLYSHSNFITRQSLFSRLIGLPSVQIGMVPFPFPSAWTFYRFLDIFNRTSYFMFSRDDHIRSDCISFRVPC